MLLLTAAATAFARQEARLKILAPDFRICLPLVLAVINDVCVCVWKDSVKG